MSHCFSLSVILLCFSTVYRYWTLEHATPTRVKVWRIVALFALSTILSIATLFCAFDDVNVVRSYVRERRLRMRADNVMGERRTLFI